MINVTKAHFTPMPEFLHPTSSSSLSWSTIGVQCFQLATGQLATVYPRFPTRPCSLGGNGKTKMHYKLKQRNYSVKTAPPKKRFKMTAKRHKVTTKTQNNQEKEQK